METSIKEQEHRHFMDKEKLKILKKSEKKNGRMNWWGMFFAFLSLIFLVGLAALALYLDKPWFATIFGAAAIISIISIFVEAGKETSKKDN